MVITNSQSSKTTSCLNISLYTQPTYYDFELNIEFRIFNLWKEIWLFFKFRQEIVDFLLQIDMRGPGKFEENRILALWWISAHLDTALKGLMID